MVSFWPWKGNASDTASFERALSTLSLKITESQTRLNKLRASARRAKVLSTIYLTFAYLVYAIVALLVVGYRNMGPYEWTCLSGGPVLIYTVRTVISWYFNFRIENLASRLKDQQEDRTRTIQKLKDATKYDSTLELIEKYGGEGKVATVSSSSDGKVDGRGTSHEDDIIKPQQSQRKDRTNIAPPPTANISRPPESHTHKAAMEPTAEFAPNAESSLSSATFTIPQAQTSYQTAVTTKSRWYDRLFDVILGEDETAPQNRIILLCCNCRLINGQAPPGVKSIAEIGRWRCMGCGAENGMDENEGQRIVREVLADHAGQEEVPVANESALDD